ncbi:MAG: hypothetical protein SNJ74_01595 [Fimbriimonadaceae bacterium]
MTAIFASILLAAAAQTAPADARLTDLGDGFTRVETRAYTIEVPTGWTVGRETSFGQRDIRPASADAGALGVMTAGPTRASWDRLYETSLWFIRRETRGTPTPYEIGRTDQGYEACSFSILDERSRPVARYVLLRSPDERVLALSVKIPTADREKPLQAAFDRMVRTARFAPTARR